LADGVTVRAGGTILEQMRGATARVVLRGVDRDAQEDARELKLAPGGRIEFSGPGNAEAYRIAFQVLDRPLEKILVRSGESAFDMTTDLSVAASKGWREMVLTKACLPDLTNEFSIESNGAFSLVIHSIIREEMETSAPCSF
jgi:beta-glucosidase